MSLRLLPAFITDNDEDDDGNFTKWMSSYWGHGAEATHTRDRKRSFRRTAKTQSDRRASLPTVSQLDAMKLNRLHAATMAAAPSHIKTREEKGEVRLHQRVRRASSDDNSRPKSAIPENRITPIPELTESFERRLCLGDKKTMTQTDDDNLCLICHEEMRRTGGRVQDLHCTHRFHKECMEQLLWKKQSCPRVYAEAPLLVFTPYQSPIKVCQICMPMSPTDPQTSTAPQPFGMKPNLSLLLIFCLVRTSLDNV